MAVLCHGDALTILFRFSILAVSRQNSSYVIKSMSGLDYPDILGQKISAFLFIFFYCIGLFIYLFAYREVFCISALPSSTGRRPKESCLFSGEVWNVVGHLLPRTLFRRPDVFLKCSAIGCVGCLLLS